MRSGSGDGPGGGHTAVLGVVRHELHLPWMVWFDTDGDPADGLHESGQPGHLRPNGTAFARVRSNS